MVRVFCGIITPEGLWNSHVCNETLYDGEDGGRTLVAGAVWTLEAGCTVRKHDDVPRSPERCRERVRGVDVDQFHRFLGARRRVMGSWCPVPFGHRTC